jgi:8-amino-7-oxononanoate synthase
LSYYKKELAALRRAGRYRSREIVDTTKIDFASNDYLGLSENKQLHTLACKKLSNYPYNASKASMLVNGYHQIHYDFERALCEANGFEDGLVLGSGFNANIALIESLVRNKDTLFIDELYHASGVLATQIGKKNIVFFRHNDMEHLKELLEIHQDSARKIIAVEGIYSMDGDLVSAEVFSIAQEVDALLIVDEAHSSGVVGENLLGVFDLYNIKIQENFIKMGTLGKAYGSFGAYILASVHIVEYLLNRAKPIIYATSLSLYDTLLAHEAFLYMQENKKQLKEMIKRKQSLIYEGLNLKIDGLIAPVVIDDNKKVMEIKKRVIEDGYSVGAIRQPTVAKAIIRVIARINIEDALLEELCKKIVYYKEVL